jgi:hypothetical protein
MIAPDRIWLDWPDANKGAIVYDEPPERNSQPGQIEYILFDLYADKVDDLESALKEAVRVAYDMGATEWVYANYRGWCFEWSEEK